MLRVHNPTPLALAPGDVRAVELEIRVPDGLDKRTRYLGSAALYTTDLEFVVVPMREREASRTNGIDRDVTMHAAMSEDIHAWGRCAGCGRPWRSQAGGLGDVATTMGDAIRKLLGGVGQMAMPGPRSARAMIAGTRRTTARAAAASPMQTCLSTLGWRATVIPVNVENTRRRERDVEVSLSSFTTSGGKPLDIQGQLLPPTSFTLGPCEEREVTMLLAVTEAPEDAGKEEKPSRASDLEERRKLPDVDECLVGYADLSITGCNLRP